MVARLAFDYTPPPPMSNKNPGHNEKYVMIKFSYTAKKTSPNLRPNIFKSFISKPRGEKSITAELSTLITSDPSW